MNDLLEKKGSRSVPMKVRRLSRSQTNQNVGWNEKLENAAKNIGEASKGYKLMHIQEAQRSNKFYNRIMILGIIMGPLSGVVSGIGAVINPSTDPPTIPIISTIFAFLSGIIVAVIKFGKYDEASNANKQAAARYTSIESNVRRQLGLYRVDRVPATPYMEWLETKYEELFLSAPLLPAGVYDSYTSVAKNLGLQVPNQYEAVITINTDYESAKVEEVVNDADIEVNTQNDPFILEKDDGIELNKTSSVHEMKGDKRVRRTNTMSQFPHLNQCSDKMLEYEMKRMMGFDC